MYQFVEKMFLTITILGISMYCNAAHRDDKKNAPQRRPVFSSEAVAKLYYEDDESSEDTGDYSIEEELPEYLGEDFGEDFREALINNETITDEVNNSKKRNYQEAFSDNSENTTPAQKVVGMKRKHTLIPADREITPHKIREEKLKELKERQKSDEVLFENNAQEQQKALITTEIEKKYAQLQQDYEQRVQELKFQFAEEKKILERSTNAELRSVKLLQQVEKIKYNRLKLEQENNILFLDLLFGNILFPGLPVEVCGVIFHYYCQDGSRANFALISKKFYDIARTSTDKLILDDSALGSNGAFYLSNLSYIFNTYPNANNLTINTDGVKLKTILLLANRPIKSLKLHETVVDDNDNFEYIDGDVNRNLLMHLRSLSVYDDIDLSPVFKQISALEELNLETIHTVHQSDEIKRLTNLKSLKFCLGNPQISNNVIKNLTQITNLCITVHRRGYATSPLTNEGLKHLTCLIDLSLPTLFPLELSTCQQLKNLRSFNGRPLTSCRVITDQTGISYVETNVALEYVRLGFHMYIANLDLGHHKKLTDIDQSQIKILDIDRSHLKNKQLQVLTNLTELYLGNYQDITNAGLKPLKNLKTLFLNKNIKISDQVFNFLPQLEVLSLAEEQPPKVIINITDKGLKLLPNLISLKLMANIIISDDGISHLTNLTELDLGLNREITDKGIKLLTNLKTLKMGENTNISPEGISNLKNLESLELSKVVQNFGMSYPQ